MVSNNQLKFIKSLHQKKTRTLEGLFIAEGKKVVMDLLHSSLKVRELYATKEFMEQNAIPKSIKCFEIKGNELERVSALTTPNEVLALCEIPNLTIAFDEYKNKLTLVLDTINDPGNLGTILRIADWFGIENIVCSETTVDVYNSKTIQSTMGSIARVKVQSTNLAHFLKECASMNLPVYGTFVEGESVYENKLSKEGIIIIGSESHGISEHLMKYISHPLSIPSFAVEQEWGRGAESLNAAIATAIICSEFRRR